MVRLDFWGVFGANVIYLTVERRTSEEVKK